jgi:hypothetical protein
MMIGGRAGVVEKVRITCQDQHLSPAASSLALEWKQSFWMVSYCIDFARPT